MDHSADKVSLAQSALFRNLFEGSIQGLILHCEGKALLVNQAYADIHGYDSPDEITALKSLLYLIAPHERARLLQYRDQRAAGNEVPEYYEYQGIRKDGSLVWLDNRISLVPWQGKLATLSAVVDISERKHLESQLQQAQKMEAIGTLASGIAHDFNNILAVINVYAELTAHTLTAASPVQPYLQEILTAGKRAKELVQQILIFSRETERQRKPIQLALLLKKTLRFIRALLPSTITIEPYIAHDTSVVLADPTQIYQVLINLCTNAEYAMRGQDGRLEIRLDSVQVDDAVADHHVSLSPGPYVCLTLRDSGKGMTPDVMERIFDPFFTTKGVGEGTGMGLAVVHGIIASHGGAIMVHSAPGKGSTFMIYFPRFDASRGEREPAADIRPQDTRRILFIDDEAAIVRSVSTLLEVFGHQVNGCTSGHEALKIFCRDPDGFDVVVTDQTMPRLSGEQLTQELRRVRPDIPIILCTGYSHTMDADKAETMGIDTFLMKPVSGRDLDMAIQQVLQKRSMQQRSITAPP